MARRISANVPGGCVPGHFYRLPGYTGGWLAFSEHDLVECVGQTYAASTVRNLRPDPAWKLPRRSRYLVPDMRDMPPPNREESNPWDSTITLSEFIWWPPDWNNNPEPAPVKGKADGKMGKQKPKPKKPLSPWDELFADGIK